MSDAEKRKELEAETVAAPDKVEEPDAKRQKPEDSPTPSDGKQPLASASPCSRDKPAPEVGAESDSKRIKPSPAQPAIVRKQVEYYLSDENLKYDKFFHDKISENSDGWLEMALVLSCNKMKAMRITKEDVAAALKDSKIEIKEDGLSIRRPQNASLPKLEDRPTHAKKSSLHAHDGGVVAAFKDIPEEQSWTQVKEKLKERMPAKTQLWFVSEVTDKNDCVIACAPFEGDAQFFDELVLEVGSAKLKCEVCHGEALQKALKLIPKHIRDKREREVKKRQKERNRPILIGTQRFANVAALRGRVKEILNSRSDGEQLKADGSDYKLIKSLLEFHPNPEKSKGMVGLKVGKAAVGESRCFHMIREGGAEEDVSSKKCLDAVELNPPYVKQEPKEGKKDDDKKDAPDAKPSESAPATTPVASVAPTDKDAKASESAPVAAPAEPVTTPVASATPAEKDVKASESEPVVAPADAAKPASE